MPSPVFSLNLIAFNAIKFYNFIHQYIAVEILYQTPFRHDSIGANIRSLIDRKVGNTAKLLGLELNFTVNLRLSVSSDRNTLKSENVELSKSYQTVLKQLTFNGNSNEIFDGMSQFHST